MGMPASPKRVKPGRPRLTNGQRRVTLAVRVQPVTK